MIAKFYSEYCYAMMTATEMTSQMVNTTETVMTDTEMTSQLHKTEVMTLTGSVIIITVALGVIIILLFCVKICQLRDQKMLRQVKRTIYVSG